MNGLTGLTGLTGKNKNKTNISDRTGSLNFVTGNSGTYRSRFIANYLFPRYICAYPDEFYLFTFKDIFDFNYSHITKTYYESEDLVWLLKKLKTNLNQDKTNPSQDKTNPSQDKKRLIIIDGINFGMRPSKNKDLNELAKFLYCDLKYSNTNIIVGTTIVYRFSTFDVYENIDNLYLSSECFCSTVKMYHKFTKDTIDIKKFAKLISFCEDNKFLSVQNIQTNKVKIKSITFDKNRDNNNKTNKYNYTQTLIYNREKFKSELHLVTGSNPYDNYLFGIKYIWKKIKDNFDKVFILTKNPKYFKSNFTNEQIYTMEKYFSKSKSYTLENKLKYGLVNDLKKNIIDSTVNFINNLLIIDIGDLEEILEDPECFYVGGKKINITNCKKFSIDTIKLPDEIKLPDANSNSNKTINTDTDSDTDSQNKKLYEKKQNYQTIKFLIENRHFTNITIIIMTRKYVCLNFTHLYMGFESDSNILVHNYNKLGFNHNFGLSIFKSVNDKLIKGKFIHKQIDHWKTTWNQKDPINIVSIDYQNKLIKPKIHLIITNDVNKKMSFIKNQLVRKISNYVDKTWIMVNKENQQDRTKYDGRFFIWEQLELVIKKINLIQNQNQLLIIDLNSNSNSESDSNSNSCTNKKLMENKNFIKLLANANKYNLTIIWCGNKFSDLYVHKYFFAFNSIHFDYLYLDRVILNSEIKSTFQSLSTNLFYLDFYKLLNEISNFTNRFIRIKYKKGFYNHYYIDYIDYVKC